MSNNFYIFLAILFFALIAYFYAIKRRSILTLPQDQRAFPSYIIFWSLLPTLFLFGLFLLFENYFQALFLKLFVFKEKKMSEIHYLLTHVPSEVSDFLQYFLAIKIAIILLLIILIVFFVFQKTNRIQQKLEKSFKFLFFLPFGFTILIAAIILGTLLTGSVQFFQKVPLFDFLFELEWQPMSKIVYWGHDYEGSFGVIPVLFGSIFVAFIAMLVALPLSLKATFYLSECISPKKKEIFKPILEILAAIPTIVYGFFALLFVSPLIVRWASFLGFTPSSENTLAAGLVMGIMVIPHILSTSLDALHSIPKSVRESSFALGATKFETFIQVLLPQAKNHIMAGILLALSRVLGETMIVVMAVGIAANFTVDPLQSITTITVQILAILTGDQEFDSPQTLVTFALALLLFILTFSLNAYALKKMREKS